MFLTYIPCDIPVNLLANIVKNAFYILCNIPGNLFNNVTDKKGPLLYILLQVQKGHFTFTHLRIPPIITYTYTRAAILRIPIEGYCISYTNYLYMLRSHSMYIDDSYFYFIQPPWLYVY